MTPDPRGSAPDIVTTDEAGPDRRGPTRRQALAVAGGGAVALGAAFGPFSTLLSAGAADGQEQAPEITLASWLVGLELAAVDLYEKNRDSSAFDAATQSLAATCSAHHEAQSSSLGSMIAATGATAPTDANSAFTAEYRPRVDAAADGAAKAAVFAEIEEGFAATYQASFTTIVSAPLAGVAAEILATDAAHAVAWSAAANGQGSDDPMPGEDALPASQTVEAAFDQAALTPATTTTTGAAS